MYPYMYLIRAGTSPMDTSGSASEEEGAESEEEEAGLELLVSGKSLEEVSNSVEYVHVPSTMYLH